MSTETSSDGSLHYHLIAFDADGEERAEADGLPSDGAAAALAEQPITDVFVFSHGWQGDVPAAKEQYRAWTGAMATGPGLDRMRAKRPDFLPLLIGLHWPSLPWGDEEVAEASFAALGSDSLIDQYAARIAGTPAALDALQVIFTAAAEHGEPETLPEPVRAAYAVLDREAGLASRGPAAAPGADREPFDPEQHYQAARADAGPASFGIGSWLKGNLLSPLRQLSFWKMKDRARSFGESGGHELVRRLMGVRPDARFHLMGHSFGCIVASATAAGPEDGPGLPRPVDSLVLVQGALSLWSYCSEIEVADGQPGYFRRVLDAVKGPIVTTQSSFDTAVGRWYPLAAGVARQVAFAPEEFPRYGGVGTFGLQGPGLEVTNQAMLAAGGDYGFEAGKIYNLDGDEFIRNGGGFSGAHSDISGPEVAHAVWEAARVS